MIFKCFSIFWGTPPHWGHLIYEQRVLVDCNYLSNGFLSNFAGSGFSNSISKADPIFGSKGHRLVSIPGESVKTPDVGKGTAP